MWSQGIIEAPFLDSTIVYHGLVRRINRYILRQLAVPAGLITLGLVGVVWLTQSLRFIDLIVNRGLSASDFLYLTILLMPGIIEVILPIAVLCAVLFVYHRLSFDSEIVVMRAAGVSPWSMAVPALALAGAATVASYILSLYLQPLGFRTFKDEQFTIRNNYAAVLIREGTFNNVIKGVTVYVRERRGSELLGILVHDERDSRRPITVMAERGTLVQTVEGPRFIMVNGNRQEIEKENRRLSLLYFDRYALDLALIDESAESRWREPSERYLDELLFPGSSKEAVQYRDKLLAEAHKRLVSPLLCLVFTLIGLAGLLSGRFDRRSEWRRIVGSAATALVVQIIGVALVPLVSETPGLTPLLYANIVAATCGSCWVMSGMPGARRIFRRRNAENPA
jgi:lipopolysaccharide export system permease protein